MHVRPGHALHIEAFSRTEPMISKYDERMSWVMVRMNRDGFVIIDFCQTFHLRIPEKIDRMTVDHYGFKANDIVMLETRIRVHRIGGRVSGVSD